MVPLRKKVLKYGTPKPSLGLGVGVFNPWTLHPSPDPWKSPGPIPWAETKGATILYAKHIQTHPKEHVVHLQAPTRKGENHQNNIRVPPKFQSLDRWPPQLHPV